VQELDILSSSETSGIHIVADRECRKFFVTGHSEYDRGTLALEYSRDVNKGLPINVPVNYFPADDPDSIPAMQWRSHASLLFSNWINFIVYQRTPFDLSQLK
jgi:homoserine O-succinyltransferase